MTGQEKGKPLQVIAWTGLTVHLFHVISGNAGPFRKTGRKFKSVTRREFQPQP